MDPKANTNSEHSPKITEAVQNDTNTLDIERVITAPDADIPHLSEKIVDGDIALTILQTHFDPFTPEEEKRVRRKIDFRMVPLMLLVNGIQYVDKNTVGNAATYGLAKQAHLKGHEFSLLVTLFYLGYFLAQYPTNILMQRFPTVKYITINFILWGTMLAAQGGATSFASLATLRFFMGVFESCVNPGFVLITSSWWKREEQVARLGLWYSANGLIGAPSGLLFYGIAHIHARGMFPYQWMFLILGLITILFGCSLWWFLPDSPLTATFLNDRERLIAVERLKSNQTGIKNSHHKAAQVKEAFTDVKVWILVWICFWQQMTNNLQTTFSGLVILGFGYSTYQAVLLSIPAQIIFAVVMIIASLFLSSRWGEGKRLFVMSLCYIPGIVSASILYSVPIKPSTRAAHLYAIFTLNIGSVAAGIGYTLLASNIAGYTKKTVAGAMFFSAYCVANIISPQTFLTSQAPRYAAGVGTTLASFAILEITLVALYFVYKRENAKRDKQNEEDGLDLTADEELINAFSDLTDLKNKRMRYKK